MERGLCLLVLCLLAWSSSQESSSAILRSCTNSSDCVAVDKDSVCTVDGFCVCDLHYRLDRTLGQCVRHHCDHDEQCHPSRVCDVSTKTCQCAFGFVRQELTKERGCTQTCDNDDNNNSTQCREVFGEAAECRDGRCLCLGQIDGNQCRRANNETRIVYIVVGVVLFVLLSITLPAAIFYLRWKWRKEAEAERRRIVLREWIEAEPHLMLMVTSRARFDYEEPRRQMIALQRRREAAAALELLEAPPPSYLELYPE